MNRSIKIAAAVVAAAGLGLWLGPPHIRDRIVGVAKFASLERRCLAIWRADFNDPHTLYVDQSFLMTREVNAQMPAALQDPGFDKHEQIMQVKVFAKNAMGGYVPTWIGCPIVGGKVDFAATIEYQTQKMIQARRAAGS